MTELAPQTIVALSIDPVSLAPFFPKGLVAGQHDEFFLAVSEPALEAIIAVPEL